MKFLNIGLEKNNSLTKLDLSKNNIGDNGMNSLSIALEKNNSLTKLDLSWNKIEGKEKSLYVKLLKHLRY